MRLAGTQVVVAAALLLALSAPAYAQLELPLPGGGPFQPPPAPVAQYANPVVPGDYPDPSVIRDGATYWAVATSGGWRPPFTVLRSKDLVNWDIAGSVLRSRPAWASGRFWAPEIVRHGRGYLVYYSAQSRRGGFCVAVASARSPAGFFRDHGPVACPPSGAIDPLPVRDERGRLHLVWKQDGNARGRPTPILAAPLTPGGLALAGPPRELFRNDAPWEGPVVEGPALGRHEGRFYLFYSARGCCGAGCDYAMGAARSPTLLGRWEKHPGPLLSGNERFRCPGHGSVVDTPNGEQYLVYHAYTAAGSFDVGRQVLLDKLDWPPSDWPVIGGGKAPSEVAAAPGGAVQRPKTDRLVDEFDRRFLGPGWQWATARPWLEIQQRDGGRLLLGQTRVSRKTIPGIVGRQPGGASFVAETVVGRRAPQTSAGIAVYADESHAVGIEVSPAGWAKVWRRPDAGRPGLAAMRIGSRQATAMRIRTVAKRTFVFEVGTESGWHQVGDAYSPPPWNGEARVVLRVAGPRRARAAFERFSLGPAPSPDPP
jgi:xylan 1,4-beta-xylosidase